MGVLAAALFLTCLSSAQSTSPSNGTAPAATPSQTLGTPDSKSAAEGATPSAANAKSSTINPGPATGRIPTAAEAQSAGAQQAAASSDESTGAPAAKVVTHDGILASEPNLPAKYNVALIGQRNIGGGLDFYSLEREVALGRQLAQEVESSARLVTDPVITEYVNRIGQNLVRNSDARVPFTIKVLDNDEVNAFALPGGFFYVDSGLILAADNEAELAGVMAHEIAHVAARHATKNMTRAQIWNLASLPLIFAGGPVAYVVAQVAGLAVPLGFLKFSRDAEREADLLGLEYDYATGYDPEAFVQFFEKLQVEKKKPNLIAKAFATHPMNVERIQTAQEEIRKYLPDRPEYVLDTSEFQTVKARLEMLNNSRRLGGKDSEPGRPVLLKRATGPSAASPAANSKQASNQSTDPPERPTLKREPASSGGDNATAGGSEATQAQASPAPATPDDSGRPVLRQSPPPASN